MFLVGKYITGATPNCTELPREETTLQKDSKTLGSRTPELSTYILRILIQETKYTSST